ncbi:dihydrodipicolinate synthase family protein [Bacillota bacterium Meth-B3]
MSKFSLDQIRGVIPAMLTVFDEDERLSEAKMRALTRHLLRYDIGGLYLTGSTGEGFMMTSEERMAAVEAVIDEVRGRVPVIVHVGAISTRASADLARHAAAAGADAISSVPPIYWKFSDDGIAGYYADLVQASGLPMIVYNIALAGLVSFDMIRRLGAIDGVDGIKYTAATHYDLPRIKQALGEDFMIYSGADEMAASGLTFGADGLIGSTYNLIADVLVKLCAAHAEGRARDMERLQLVANRVIFALLEYDLMPALKLCLTFMGVDAGVSRRPFTRYDAAQAAAMRARFELLKAQMAGAEVDFLNAL